MSRTKKDKPWKLVHPRNEEGIDFIYTEGYSRKYLPTKKPKKRKELDTEWHWMTTPSWWTRLMMGRPERRAAHLQETAVLKAPDLEDFDFIDRKRKPHIYYW